MHSIKPPVTNDELNYKEITAAKEEPNKQHLLNIQSIVFDAYVDYNNKIPAVDTVSSVALTNDQRDALLHAYSSETKAMNHLRDLLLSAIGAQRCPFCALSESHTLDHYLPKKRYPQYAVFSQNLIPCCGKCNQKKLNQVLDLCKGNRLFLHPYFDFIPNERILSLTIKIYPDAMALRYKLSPPTNVSQATSSQLLSHFELLGLGERYRLMSLDELRGQHKAIAKRFGTQGNFQGVQELLAEQSETLAQQFGFNHWRSVLYEALAAHEPFCKGGFNVILKSK